MNRTQDEQAATNAADAATHAAENAASSNAKIAALEKRLAAVETAVADNTVLTASIKQDTSAITDFFKDAAGGARILLRLGKFGKAVAPFVVLASAIYGFYILVKTGAKP